MFKKGIISILIIIFFSSYFYYLFPYFSTSIPKIIEGKNIIVTGASLGIGKELVKEFIHLKISQIVLISRNNEKLNELKEDILKQLKEKNEILPIIHIIPADLSNEEICNEVIEKSYKLMGSIDYLVLNHITNSQYGLWKSHKTHEWLSNMYAVNTLSYIWLTNSALPYLSSSTSSGNIVIISSFAGWVGVPFTATYSSTKHALRGFFNALRTELELYEENNKISITICNIGAVNTEGSKEFQSRIQTEWIQPDSVAKAIIAGSALRYREVYYPFYVYPTIILHFYFPKFIEWMLKTTMN